MQWLVISLYTCHMQFNMCYLLLLHNVTCCYILLDIGRCFYIRNFFIRIGTCVRRSSRLAFGWSNACNDIVPIFSSFFSFQTPSAILGPPGSHFGFCKRYGIEQWAVRQWAVRLKSKIIKIMLRLESYLGTLKSYFGHVFSYNIKQMSRLKI